MNTIFNKELFHKENVKLYQHQFLNAQPFKHICLDNFLEKNIADTLYEHFPPLSQMKKKYNGINEKKSEDSQFDKLHPAFNLLKKQLQSIEFVSFIEQITGIHELITVNDQRGSGLHQGGNGSFLDIHIDFNIHPILNIQRRLNLILFLNKDWEHNWGGELEFWNKNVDTCICKYEPIHNRCIIFETNEISYHGYSQIHIPDESSRKSFYTYYYTPIKENIKYHDTVFQSRPEEQLWKKTATKLKDGLKNIAKSTIKRIGFDFFSKSWNDISFFLPPVFAN